MVDILPEETRLWQSMETVALEVLSSYGYSEIRLPIIESTDLFARSIGLKKAVSASFISWVLKPLAWQHLTRTPS